MENVTLQHPLTRALPLGLRTMLAQVVARLHPAMTAPVRRATDTAAIEHAAALLADRTAPARQILRGHARRYPQRRAPVRPALSVYAAPRLAPHAAAPRAPLGYHASEHLHLPPDA